VAVPTTLGVPRLEAATSIHMEWVLDAECLAISAHRIVELGYGQVAALGVVCKE